MIEKLPVKGKMHAKNEFLRPVTGNFCNLFFSCCLFRKPLFIFLFNTTPFRECDANLEFLK